MLSKNSKQNKFLSFLLVCSFLVTGFSGTLLAQENQASHKFDLNDCIHYALQNQASVKNQLLSEKISRESVREAYSKLLPQVTAGAKYQYTIKRQVSYIGGNPVFFGVPQQFQGYVDINQTLFDPSVLGSTTAAHLAENMSKENTQLSKINLVSNVMKAYYGVLVFREQLRLLSANIVRDTKSLSDTKYQFKNGLAQKVDVDRIQVLVNNDITAKNNALRNLKTLRQTLKYHMGMPIEDSLTVTGSINDSLLSAVLPEQDTTFYKNRVEYRQANTELKASKLLKNNAIRSYFPTLSAFYSLTAPFNGQTFPTLFDGKMYPTSYVGLQLTIPVFSGLTKHFQYQAAKMNIEISQNSMKDLKNSIKLEYGNYYRQYLSDMENLKTQKENTKLAQLNYDNLKYQYDNGVQPLIEVLNAETTLLQAQENYINSLYQALVDKVDLDRSLGKIKY
ncbi:MAG: TolC family protein [Bacteroidales bacterium]|nr:TolC family protein [Bacteroidales bacterium]